MSDLTLEQVKKAGRFAWHESAGQALIFTNGQFLRFHEVYGRTKRPCDDLLEFWPNDKVALRPEDSGQTRYGWHHLPGCDCEFCNE